MDETDESLWARFGELLARARDAETVDAALEVIADARADHEAGLSLQEAFDGVRAAVLRRCRELTNSDADVGRSVLLGVAIPACLDVIDDDAVCFHARKVEIAEIVAQWIEQYDIDARDALRDAALDALVPRVRDGSYAATELAIEIGYRRDDLELALAHRLDAPAAESREQALGALLYLGLAPELRERSLGVARALLGETGRVRASILLGDVSALDGLAARIAACPDEATWWRKLAGLAALPSGLAWHFRDEPAFHDQAWSVAHQILESERDRPFVTMQIVGSIDATESARVPCEFLSWLATDPAERLESALMRLLRCTAPAHRVGWARVEPRVLEWLRAKVSPSPPGPHASRYWDRSELALRTLMCAGDRWPVHLASTDPDAVRASGLLQIFAADSTPDTPARPVNAGALLERALATQSPRRADCAVWQRIADADPRALAAVDWPSRARGWHPAGLTALADVLATLPSDAPSDSAVDLLWQLASHSSPTVSDAALHALSTIAADRLFAEARASAARPDEASRARAARLLGVCLDVDRSTLVHLLDPLLADRHRTVRSVARAALDALGDRRRVRDALRAVIATAHSAPRGEDVVRAWLDHELLANRAEALEMRALARASRSGRCSALARAWLAYLSGDIVASIRMHATAEPWARVTGDVWEIECVLAIPGSPGSLSAAGTVWSDGQSWGAELISTDPRKHLGQEEPDAEGEPPPLRIIDRPPPRTGHVGGGSGLTALGEVLMSAEGATHRLELLRWDHDRTLLRGVGPCPITT